MIALTQEKREELANYAKERLASHVKHGGCSDEEEIFKIALASLTALPEYYQLRGNDNGWTGFISLDAMIMAERAGIETRSLYTIHPVPEIKLPSRIENIHLRTPLEVEDMWIDRFKRLNGLGE